MRVWSPDLGEVNLPGLVPGAPVAGPVVFRNILDGGDFTVNPFQRNIAAFATAGVITTPVTNTPTYFADRFFGVGGASSALLMAKVADVTVPGFGTSLKLQRQAANANTATLNLGQVVESGDSIRCQGQLVVFSLWARAGANYSGGPITVQMFSGTGTNDTAANMVAGSWAGSTTPINVQQAISTVMTRYFFAGIVPANCTQLGVNVSFTPSGTAGADDSITVNGLQLELGVQPGPFEHRDAQVELEIAQRYAWITAEPANGVVVGSGMNTGASAQSVYMATPVQMLKAPTVTVVAGTFKTNQAGTLTATTITPGGTHTPNAITINGNSAGTAGQGILLTGGGGNGAIVASADF